jgi:ubiquinone/menaquinone biosynthesis C-methylase UbiE
MTTLHAIWSAPFRLGLYDLFLPINFDASIRTAFDALQLPPDAHLLDVGCGSGRLIVHAAAWLRAGGRYTGVDIAAGGLSYGERRARMLDVADRVTLRAGDMRVLSSALTGPYDAAIVHFSSYTLAVEAERQRAVAEIGRLLRPGARLSIVVPSETYAAKPLVEDAQREETLQGNGHPYRRALRQRVIYPLLERATRRHVESRLDDGTFHRYSEGELTAHLREGGFDLEQLERHYGVESYRALAVRRAHT